ncbi:MAG: hypothetical protein ALECFALPRED_007119 [Alectoria fallacina]|uniref:Embryonic stem cell-specific 5-hydroxymethylcytosine-binding protein n=1 Tax=Alectoria fallacina TaxID=1903189 RepID=A0A8H3IXN4_9LECA|nr:MAG: hypothetical protein ALECFALPRED_007119 [Alectoria fallacina]
MCGRYALGIRASFVRHQLQEHDMPVEDAPDDADVRETYNFAPGNHGLVYRADVPDYGAGGGHHEREQDSEDADQEKHSASTQLEDPKETRYKLQSMKWGLIPFWTKRNPDYGTVMRTINARDDSLASKGGMWNTMKQKKRCIVIAQGFYEWLKKSGGKEKIPHYVKRKDEQLMCFAGLWDCVQYEGSNEKHYTYTIITTDSNKQLTFLHDRMPVILENGSDRIRTWLDPSKSEWSKDLQSLLKPFEGELDCYPVSRDVGKVGNNSPTFIVPVASTDNKNNIANFFSNVKKSTQGEEEKKQVNAQEEEVKDKGFAVEHEKGEARTTVNHTSTEDNAPLPAPVIEPSKLGLNRDLGSDNDDESTAEPLKRGGLKREHPSEDHGELAPAGKSLKTEPYALPTKSPEKTPNKKRRSATKNGTVKGSPAKRTGGSQKITNFYK